MFKWLGSLPKALSSNEFKEPHVIKIGPMFDIVFDKVEYPDEELQDERINKVTQWLNEKYSSSSSSSGYSRRNSNDRVVLVNFTRYTLELLSEKIQHIDYGATTCFHYEQVMNMLYLCHVLHKIVESDESSSATVNEDEYTDDFDDDGEYYNGDEYYYEGGNGNGDMDYDERSVGSSVGGNFAAAIEEVYNQHRHESGELTNGSSGSNKEGKLQQHLPPTTPRNASHNNITINTTNKSTNNNRINSVDSDKSSTSTSSSNSSSGSTSLTKTSSAHTPRNHHHPQNKHVGISNAPSPDDIDDDDDISGILSGSGVMESKKKARRASIRPTTLSPQQQQRSQQRRSLHQQQQRQRNRQPPRVNQIVFYCTADNLLYGLLMGACLIHFSSGDRFIESWLMQNLKEVQHLFILNSPRTPRTAQNSMIPIAENVQASLMRYCKFFTLLIQLPMPYITVYTLDRICLNSLIGLMNSPRPSPRGVRLPSQQIGGEGKLYIVVKQNEQELYGAFFQQHANKPVNSGFMIDNSQSSIITDSNGETWYAYDIQKTGQAIYLMGDFVICCYWVVRDTFTKLFRFTFNTMFIRNETHLSDQKQLDLTQPRSKLDWVDDELIPHDFILQLHFTERSPTSNANTQAATQNYRDGLERFLKLCPFYYLNDFKSKIELRLAHVVRNNEGHLNEMSFVITELKSRFASQGRGWLRAVPSEERFDANWTKDTTKKKPGRSQAKVLAKFGVPPPEPGSASDSGDETKTSPLIPPLSLDGASSGPVPPPPPINGLLLPPPPPPSVPGFFPPPPPMPGLNKKLERKDSMMKRLDWKPIKKPPSENDLNSVWTEMSSEISVAKDLVGDDVDALKTLFAQKPATAKLPQTTKTVPDNQISILPGNLSRNLGIVLASQFRGIDDAKHVITKIMNFDPSLQPAQVSSLHQLITSVPDEVRTDLIKAGCSEYDRLPKVEQFLFHFIMKERLVDNMQSLIYVNTIPELFDQLNEKLELKILSCKAVRSSEGFRKILAYVLAIGNVMNEGRRNLTGVTGFNLDILPKLDGTRANDSSTKSLLHFLAKMIKEKEEVVCSFYAEDRFEELVSKSARIGLTSLIPLQKQFATQVEHLQKEFKYYLTNSNKISDEAMQKLKDATESASDQYDYLKTLSEECEQLYLETLDYYHFEKENSGGETDGFFALINDFVTKFKRACEENRLKDEQERAKARRQQNAKLKQPQPKESKEEEKVEETVELSPNETKEEEKVESQPKEEEQ